MLALYSPMIPNITATGMGSILASMYDVCATLELNWAAMQDNKIFNFMRSTYITSGTLGPA